MMRFLAVALGVLLAAPARAGTSVDAPPAPVAIDPVLGVRLAAGSYYWSDLGKLNPLYKKLDPEAGPAEYGPPSPQVYAYLQRRALHYRPELDRPRTFEEKTPLMAFGVAPKVDAERARSAITAGLAGLAPEEIQRMPADRFAALASRLWDGLVRDRAVVLDDGTGSVAFPRGPGSPGLLHYRTGPGKLRPLRQTDPRLPALLGSASEPPICGPACVVSVASRFPGQESKHPFLALREVLALLPRAGATLKRAVQGTGIDLAKLRGLTELRLRDIGVRARVRLIGASYDKKKTRSDVAASDILGAERRPLIAYLRGKRLPTPSHSDRQEAAWRQSSGTDYRHFVVIERGWRAPSGRLEALVDDPWFDRKYAVELVPLKSPQLGYRTFKILRSPAQKAARAEGEGMLIALASAVVIESDVKPRQLGAARKK